MKRRIIEIDRDKCNGCGEACHEGAIGMVDGKAKLMWDDPSWTAWIIPKS